MQQEISTPSELPFDAGASARLAPPACAWPSAPAGPRARRAKLELRRLVGADESAALAFLRREPVLNFQLIGLIRENGLESRDNRGTFYGCTRAGRLVGVALLGEWVSLAGADEVTPVFARAARRFHADKVRVALLPSGDAGDFARVFAGRGGLTAADDASHVLLVKDADHDGERGCERLNVAEPFDLEEVLRAHVRACLETNGTDPSRRDPEGFRQRLLARVEMGRVWVVRDAAGRVIFKTDVAVETDEVAYLEAVWTAPEHRGRGLGGRAVKDLTRRLLGCYRAVCLFAAADKPHLVPFYQRLGYRALGAYRLLRYQC
ncbi:MAG TPA: GNAT family N-acetyltransferase [Pyrinomonadaceae bacterium]|nr:GNAT family N-acetyltransferase [Pyrinomonadaceae bacterium]